MRHFLSENKYGIFVVCVGLLFEAFIVPTNSVSEQTDTFLPSGLIYSQCYHHLVDIFGIEFPQSHSYAFAFHMNNETFQCDDLQS